jgi:hypothetical protein
MKNSRAGRIISRSVLLILYVCSAAVFIYYLWDGLDYYLTPMMERPHLAGHQNIKPGGIRGHGLGILGTLLMILLLAYSLRKRKIIFGNLGNIATWLDFHIFLGIMGPMFVVLHTSFKLNGIVAVSFWSMIAVFLSGILGRYLYLQIPRNISGNELDMQDLDQTYKKMTRSIFNSFQVDHEYISRTEKTIIGEIDPNRNSFSILIALMVNDLSRFFRIRRARKRLRKLTGISKRQARELVEITRKKAVLNRRIILWTKIHQLFYYWHVIHKPFAIIMYVIMLIHVALTVLFGYKWIF